MALGDNQTPYLHLNLGTDAVENRNWAVLDRRLYDLARGLITNIVAGGDLAGTYPDPTIRPGAVTPDKLAPSPPTGGVPIVQANGTFAWFTGTPPTGVAGGDLSGTYPNPQVVGSAAGVLLLADRARITGAPTQANFAANLPPDAGYQVNNSGWLVSMDYGALDQWSVQRRQPGSATYTPLLRLDGATGKFTCQLADSIVSRVMTNPDLWLSPIPVAGDLGKVLTVAAGPTLAWTFATGSGGATGPAGGDLTGSYPNPSLSIIQSAKVQLAGRGAFFNGSTGASVGVNDPTHDPAYVAASASWVANYLDTGGSDEANISRRAPNAAAGAFTKLLTVNADGTIRVTTNPVNVLDLATKQYVDGMVGGGGPPTGAAGGSLAGFYPNPTLANNAVQTVNIQPGAVTGAVIANGGIIAGKFATDAIRTADILDQQITQGKLALNVTVPPSGVAGGDLAGTYPNPTLSASQKNLWQASASALFPIDQTKPVVVLSSSAGLADSYVMGTAGGPARAYLGLNPVAGATRWQVNASLAATLLDDTSKPAWQVNLGGGDSIQAFRAPATAGAPAYAQLLLLDSAGKLTLPGDATKAAIQLGGLIASKSRIQAPTSGIAATWLALSVNRDANSGAIDDTTKPAYQLTLNANADQLALGRWPANAGAAGSPLVFDGGSQSLVVRANARPTTLRLQPHPTVDNWAAVTLNRYFDSGGTWQADSLSYPSWSVILDSADAFRILRSPAGTPGGGGNMLFLDNVGNLSPTNFVLPRARSCYIQLTNMTFGASAQGVTITFSSVIADAPAMANTQFNQIIPPDAAQLILLTANISQGNSNGALMIQQWNGSAWVTRASVTSPQASQVATQLSVTTLADTRFGQQFQLAFNNNVASNVVMSGLNYFSAILLGKTP